MRHLTCHLAAFFSSSSSSPLKLTNKYLGCQELWVCWALLSRLRTCLVLGESQFTSLGLAHLLSYPHPLSSFTGRPELWFLLLGSFSTQDLLQHQLSINYRHTLVFLVFQASPTTTVSFCLHFL